MAFEPESSHVLIPCSPATPVLRVVLVLWSGEPGGAEMQTVSLARFLRQRGHDASVVFVCHGAPLSASLDALGVPYQVVGHDRGRAVFLAPSRFVETVAASKPDAVVIAAGAALVMLLRRLHGRSRFIYVEHCGSVFASLPGKLLDVFGRFCRRWWVDVDVAVSDYMRDVVSRQLHAPRLVRIHNGVDLDLFRPRTRPPAGQYGPELTVTLGFAGRLTRGKGVEDLLTAAARLGEAQPFEVRIAGDGADRPQYEKLARKLGLDARVKFLGKLTDMASFWQGCDLGVVPTNTLVESFGMVAVEAMACGIPVVASDRGGLAEVVLNEETGLLFPAGNVEKLRKCLSRYLNDPCLRRAHGAAARRRATDNFDIRACAETFEKLCLT